MLDLSGSSAVLVSSELPDSLRHLIVCRLRYLPEPTVAALRSASLLGDAFSLADLASVTGRRATELVEELAEAFRAGLVADHRGVLAFRHQLVRDAIYEDIPEAARVALHREAAGALVAAGAPLTQVASHIVLGAIPRMPRQAGRCASRPARPLRGPPAWLPSCCARPRRCCRRLATSRSSTSRPTTFRRRSPAWPPRRTLRHLVPRAGSRRARNQPRGRLPAAGADPGLPRGARAAIGCAVSERTSFRAASAALLRAGAARSPAVRRNPVELSRARCRQEPASRCGSGPGCRRRRAARPDA